MTKRLFIILSLVVICSLVITGCTNQGTNPTAQSTSAGKAGSQPQNGGNLKIITQSSIRNIGYPGAEIFPSDGTVTRPVVEALVGMDESGSEAPVPQLATGWTFSPDYKSLTVNLRKGVKFHDGTDFNAEAAKFCLDLVRTSTRPELVPVSSIDVVDNYTIKLNLSSYEPTFLSQLIGMPTWMISPTAIKKLDKGAATNPVGTGPFKFVSYQRDASIKYQRFDGYWGDKAHVDSIEWVIIADPVTSLTAFKAGEGQAMASVTPDDAAALAKTGKYRLTPYFQQIQGFCGDSAHSTSPFADIRVRRAMAYAVDTRAMASALGGEYYPATNQFSIPGSYGYNPKIVGYPYNVEKAKALMKEAGLADGLSTTLMYQSGTLNRNTFTAVQNYLGQIGIKVKLDEADAARFRDVTAKGWQNYLVSFDSPASKGYDPARMFVGRLSSESHRYDPKSLARSAEFDALLNKSNREFEATKRLAMLQELHRMIIDESCMSIPLYAPSSIKAESLQVNDLNVYGFGGPQDWQPTKVWLSK
jgi:peptide/nickel transport system substrate-binding protein